MKQKNKRGFLLNNVAKILLKFQKKIYYNLNLLLSTL